MNSSKKWTKQERVKNQEWAFWGTPLAPEPPAISPAKMAASMGRGPGIDGAPSAELGDICSCSKAPSCGGMQEFCGFSMVIFFLLLGNA